MPCFSFLFSWRSRIRKSKNVTDSHLKRNARNGEKLKSKQRNITVNLMNFRNQTRKTMTKYNAAYILHCVSNLPSIWAHWNATLSNKRWAHRNQINQRTSSFSSMLTPSANKLRTSFTRPVIVATCNCSHLIRPRCKCKELDGDGTPAHRRRQRKRTKTTTSTRSCVQWFRLWLQKKKEWKTSKALTC